MKPVKRPDHNFVYKSPDVSPVGEPYQPDENVGDLSCKVEAQEGRPAVVSHWAPSEEELNTLNSGGTIELTVWQEPIPPLLVTAVEEMEGQEENPYRQDSLPHPLGGRKG